MKNIKNFFSYALGDLFVKGILFISLPLLTRVMDPEQYGKLSILNTAILILYVFTSLNMQSAVLNRYMKDKENFQNYLGSCLIFLVPFHLFLVITAQFYSGIVSKALGFSQTDFMSVLIICILLSYIYIYTSYLQAAERGLSYVKINVFSKLSEIILIFVFALLMATNQYLSKIYAQLLVSIPLLFYSCYRMYTIAEFKINYRYIKDALVFSLPLIIHVLSNSLLSQVDRVIINEMMGSTSAGIYSFAYNLGMCVIVLIMAWNSSWQPKLYQLINERKTEKINQVNNSTAVMIFIITSICILFSKEMVIIMADEKYYAGIDVVPLIMIGNSLIYIYLTYVNFVFYKKSTALISVTTLMALGINIVANYKLIPHYGIMGSAVATLIAYLALCLFHYCTARYLIGIYDRSLIKLKSLFYYFTGLAIIYIVMYIVNKEPILISLGIKISVMAIMITYIFKTKKYKDMVV